MRLHEISLPSPIADASTILTNAGYRQIGNGSYAQVFSKDGSSKILKLVDSNDVAYRAFVEIAISNPNPHFPKFFGKPMKVSNDYYAIQTELLQHLPDGSDKLNLYCQNLWKFFRAARMSEPWEADLEAVEWVEKQPELLAACNIIIENLLPKFSIDINFSNLMWRNETCVFIDPVRPHSV